MTLTKRLLIIIGTVIILLLIPFTAMQFTDEVNWGVMDFVIMGALLLAMGLLINMIGKRIRKKTSKILLIAAVVVVFMLVWAELAVGLFGTPIAGS
ncbi:hypothetical protein J1N09_11935 [Aureitalea sp. L0-47]|uniref:hypothetical protein n=1 Tax=Aureitalea sp. L0-47 TaxID=2816962 RepID=UPI00223851CB|nr:hypothetical protein [Aureitalea sp. L0-47]MCW5520555.1 hypothetical protein [Aureitalea sp. L0-47]